MRSEQEIKERIAHLVDTMTMKEEPSADTEDLITNTIATMKAVAIRELEWVLDVRLSAANQST